MTTLHTRAADMPTTEQLLREAVATLRAFIKPLRAMGHQSDAIDAAPDLMARIDAYLAQQSALDELVRENERLGLYDDQRPVAWRCRDYVTGCWFISVKPDPAGSIAGESVPLYAAPAPAQPLSDEQIERHTLRAGDCPPDSAVILVSTIKRFAERAITGEKP